MAAKIIGGIDQVCLGAPEMRPGLVFLQAMLKLTILEIGWVKGPHYETLFGLKSGTKLRYAVLGLPGTLNGLVRVIESTGPAANMESAAGYGIFDVDFWVRDLDAVTEFAKYYDYPLWTDPLAYQVADITVRELIIEPYYGVRSALIQDVGRPSGLSLNPDKPTSEATISAVCVRDLEAGIAFYRYALGLEPLRVFTLENAELNQILRLPASASIRVALMDMPHCRLELLEVTGVEGDRPDNTALQRPPHAGFQGYSFLVTDLDQAVTSCAAAGATILSPMIETTAEDILHGPARVQLVRDPQGVTLELVQRYESPQDASPPSQRGVTEDTEGESRSVGT